MSGPFAFPSDMMSLDQMLSQMGEGWDGLERSFQPAPTRQPFEPEDDLKKTIALFYDTTPEGRRMMEWIFDLTFRAPYPPVGGSFEQAALAAKAHEARAAVGRVLVQTIVDGRALMEKTRSQNHADPAR